MSKQIIVTVIDMDTGMIDDNAWEVPDKDSDGKVRAAIGSWLSDLIGGYRWKTSNWITRPREDQTRDSRH